MTKVGYARVSSKEQNLDRQIEALKNYGCEEVFQEKVSGKNINDRTELKRLLEFIRKNDEVVVISLDRLGRNMDDLDKILQTIKEKEATFTAFDLPSLAGIEDDDIRRLFNTFTLEMFKYVSQSERKRIKERQRQGIEIAKTKGVYKGSKPKYRADTTNKKDKLIYETVIEMLRKDKRVSEIVKKTGISKNTVKAINMREYLKPEKED